MKNSSYPILRWILGTIALSVPLLTIPTLAQTPPPPSTTLPLQSRILQSRGQSLYELGRYEDALITVDKVLADYPDSVEALELRGNTLQRLKRYDEALVSYDQALHILEIPMGSSISPESGDAIATLWTERARVLAHLNRYEESVSSYDQAIQHRCAQRLSTGEPMPEVCQSYNSAPETVFPEQQLDVPVPVTIMPPPASSHSDSIAPLW